MSEDRWTLQDDYERYIRAREKTLAYQWEQLGVAIQWLICDVVAEIKRALGPFWCTIGIHRFSPAHPHHYCGRCGRFYGLRK